MGKPLIRSVTWMAHRSLWAVLAALAALAAHDRMVWGFLLAALLLLYLIWSYLWAFLSCRHLLASESLAQTNLYAGDSVNLSWQFENTWSFPLSCCGLRLYLPDAFLRGADGGLSFSKMESDAQGVGDGVSPAWICAAMQQDWIAAKDRRTVSLGVTAPLRGCYYLPPAQVFAGDPSGLYQGTRRTGGDRFLTVLPRFKGEADLHRAASFNETFHRDLFGLDDPYQAMGVRDYETGDSPKHINWYATARTTCVKSNLFERQISASCLVALDLSCGFGPVIESEAVRREDPLLEEAISLACGIALSQLSRGVQTAFFTNAPTLYWERVPHKAPPGDFGYRLRRSRSLTQLGFQTGTKQENSILKLCASIDDTSRAALAGQRLLWEKMMQIPAKTTVYLLRYHTPPESWERLMRAEQSASPQDPADFYTPGRLAGLPSSSVHVIDLSRKTQIHPAPAANPRG